MVWKGERHRHSVSRKGIKTKGIRYIGSQTREPIGDTNIEIIAKRGKEVLVFNPENNEYERYVRNDDFAGHVLEINGKGYEFTDGLPIYDNTPISVLLEKYKKLKNEGNTFESKAYYHAAKRKTLNGV